MTKEYEDVSKKGGRGGAEVAANIMEKGLKFKKECQTNECSGRKKERLRENMTQKCWKTICFC